MKSIPKEIKLHILSFLRDKQSLGRVSQASKEWNILVKQDMLWSPFLYMKKMDNAKEIYKKILAFSKYKVLYYMCTSNNLLLTKRYQIPPDFKFRDIEKHNLEIEFYAPRSIGCGTHIGNHADMIKTLKKASCVVINVTKDGYQHFSYYINKLLKITDIKIKDTPLLKAPESLESFPQIPIIIITESDFVDAIRQQAKSNNISLYKIIPRKLSSYNLLEPNQDTDEIKNTWLELENVIMRSVLHNVQKTGEEIAEEKDIRKKCSIQ